MDKRQARNRWWLQIAGIYQRGYQAFLDGKTEDDCPYKDYTGCGHKGVQSQRYGSWMRGFERAKAGKPLNDING